MLLVPNTICPLVKCEELLPNSLFALQGTSLIWRLLGCITWNAEDYEVEADLKVQCGFLRAP